MRNTLKICSIVFCLYYSPVQAQETSLLAQAQNSYNSENYDASLALAESILETNGKDFEALLLKGDSHQKKDEFDMALDAYKKAYRINKNSAVLCTNLGAALLNTDDLEGAEKKLKEALALDDSYAPAHYFLGNVKYADFNVSAAIKLYNKAIALNPKYRDALYMRAASYAEKEEVGKALADYEEVHKLDPSLNLVSFNMAVINLDNEQFEKALELFDEIDPSVLPKAVDYFFYKAEALYYSDQKEEACLLYGKAAKMGDTEAAEIHHRFCLNREERNKKREKTVIRASF